MQMLSWMKRRLAKGIWINPGNFVDCKPPVPGKFYVFENKLPVSVLPFALRRINQKKMNMETKINSSPNVETNLNVPEGIVHKIYIIRGHQVLLDLDLASLYGVETKQLKRSVRRNIHRFPEDFMFTISLEEQKNLRCQTGTSSWGGVRYSTMAFTEQGVAMLSSVLNSEKAIRMNIAIMRAFVQLRQFLLTNKELSRKIEELEKTVSSHDQKIQMIFQAIKQLIEKKDEPAPQRKPVGYKLG